MIRTQYPPEEGVRLLLFPDLEKTEHSGGDLRGVHDRGPDSRFLRECAGLFIDYNLGIFKTFSGYRCPSPSKRSVPTFTALHTAAVFSGRMGGSLLPLTPGDQPPAQHPHTPIKHSGVCLLNHKCIHQHAIMLAATCSLQ